MADFLALYKKKRNFALTAEPADGGAPNERAPAFVVQKHWASRLHYDLRLELDGVMKSWAVPKGPSYDPKDKRMAVQVEDHPIAYNQFEGDIPAGQYGAGKVIIWDEGSWTPPQDARKGYRDGMLKFELHGVKLKGKWALIRMKGRDEKQPPWLLIKEKDEFVRPAAEFSVVDEAPDSVVPLRKPVTAARTVTKAMKATKRPSGRSKAPVSPAPVLPGEDAELPATLAPQLATLVDGVPAEPADWLFEIKFDGYRLLTRVEGESVRLFTRNGNDWTHKLEKLATAIGKLKLSAGWLDGEIVVLNDAGVPSFQALQNAFDAARTAEIVYYLFDAPYLGGRDLRREPLEVRRELLRQLIGDRAPPALRFSEAFDVAPRDLVASACRMGLEGVIGKRRGSPYVTRRSDTWIKLKCAKRQEFIIAGYTDPKGSRSGFGSLLLAVNDEHGGLRYAGNVGTGFDERTLGDIKRKLDALGTSKSPFASPTDLDRTAHWVKPQLVAEVSFGEWTTTGRIRHSVFRGLRSDKPAKAITREKPHPVKSVEPEAPAQPKSGRSAPSTSTQPLRVTNPDRVIDPSTGLTKLDVVRFYALVAPLLVEHLKARPVSLVRAPSGIQGELFFQKHLEGKMPGVKALDKALDPDHPSMLEVPSPQAVVSAAQMNVIEFHTWNAVKTAIGKPDRMTFDLDPGEGVPWKTMLQAAELVRTFLSQLGLTSFAKTSGGKGLHVVVPLKKQYGWETVKPFSQAIVQHLARTLPQLFVAKSGPRNRVGKIFIDYLRNGFGATTASAWSARARPGLGVSVPVHWDEVGAIKSGAQWTVANIHTRLDQGNAPWEGYAPQTLGKAMKLLDFESPTR
ncbi:DNA ligase D [Achromobacter pestifer]|uniref:DNA ligase (ATP) n=1 Tax=Achromobacter pestifer TaxID=1353889 RepID=A0A6S6YVS7_9BURK|nr:DNA ligase D [Achromobacter pestifer]CAB3647485.1 Multifunctional non-homologous end joining protein LigD [Achromobacter pestifer]